MKTTMRNGGVGWIAIVTALLLFATNAHAGLLGVNRSDGNLYSISASDASIAAIGSTGLTDAWGALEFSSNGTLYGITTGSTAGLYTINPSTAAATLVGPLNLNFVFEGGLAFSPSGIAYAVNGDSNGNPQLFTVNLSTGSATVVGTMTTTPGATDGGHDINGLAWRSDGKLVGLDDNTNSLLVIDPTTAQITSTLVSLPTVGALGGMTVLDGTGYFSLNSGDLYSFDLFSGANTLVGPMRVPMSGLAGLSETVPEPATLGLLGIALAGIGLARRRKPI